MLYSQIPWRRAWLAARIAESQLGRQGWRAFLALLSVAVVLIAAPTASAGETRIGINGARLSELLPGSEAAENGWLSYANRIGVNWLPGMTSMALDYPAQLGPLWGVGALTGDQSTTIGQQNLHAAILAELAKGQKVYVAGGSMGTLVIDREIAYLETLASPPPADAITFYIFGGESRGFGKTYAPGATLPIVGTTLLQVPETRYNTVLVYSQWDGWANPPDRPWNVLAVLNAVMGVFLTTDEGNDHSEVMNSSPADAVLVSETTNSLGGKTSTYMIPTTDLPITRPLRMLGVPKSIVDTVNSWLLPIIARGYSSMTPGVAPHFDKGRLVWSEPAEAPAASPIQRSGLASAAAEITVPEPSSASNDAAPPSHTVLDPLGESVEPKPAEPESVVYEPSESTSIDIAVDDQDADATRTEEEAESTERARAVDGDGEPDGDAVKEPDSSDTSVSDVDEDVSPKPSADSGDREENSESPEPAAA